MINTEENWFFLMLEQENEELATHRISHVNKSPHPKYNFILFC